MNRFLRRAAFALVLLPGLHQAAQAQTGGVGIGTPTPDPSALLDLRSTTKGLLAPRMTAAQVAAIVNPADGLLVYRTDGVQPGLVYFRAGTGWIFLNPTGAADNLGNHTATQNLSLNGQQLLGAGRLDLLAGADASGTGDPGAVAFQYRTGGFRHWLRSRHDDQPAGSGNNLDFFLNSSATAAGSSAPGTGNIQVLTLQNTGGQPRVGIGTATPAQPLDVVGNVQISGSGNGLKFPDGTTQTSAALDNQTLSVSGQTLTISKVTGTGSSVTLPGGSDNLGNHTATQNLSLNGKKLTGGGTNGLAIGNTGAVQVDALAGTGTSRLVSVAADGTLQAQNPFVDAATINATEVPTAVGTNAPTGGLANDVEMNPSGTRAYVVCGANTLQAYDISNPNATPVPVGAAVPTGNAPLALAINTAGTRAYVVNVGSNSLQMYDISNVNAAPVAVGAAVGTGASPIHLALNPANTRAYVLNNASNSLQMYDISNVNAAPVPVGAAVPTGANPGNIAVNPAGTRAYLVNAGSNTLQAYDISNPAAAPVAVGAAAPTGAQPRGLALSQGGTRAYVTTSVGNSLQAYDISNPAVGPVAVGTAVATGANPIAVLVNPAGTRAYVLGFAANTLQAFDIAGTTPVAVGPAAATGAAPSAGTINAAGSRIYLLARNANALQVYSVSGSNYVLLGSPGGFISAVSPGTLGDNLGSHTATQNLNLGTNQLVGNGGTTGLSIGSGGSVGIGTTTPAQKLDVSGSANVSGNLTTGGNASVSGNAGVSGTLGFGSTTRQMLNLWGTQYGIGVQNNTQYFRSGDSFVWYTGGSHADGQFDGGSGSSTSMVLRNGRLGLGTANPECILDVPNGSVHLPGDSWIRYFGDNKNYLRGTTILADDATGGRVGIGTADPVFPLDVQSTITPANFNYGYLNGSGATGYGSNNTGPVSIRATGRVLAAEFNATSDRRLKSVIGLSDRAADLALLTKIRITDYTMRDRVQYGSRQFKKVIAQEVEEVFPQAVNQHAGFLPDVYAVATAVEAVGDSLLRLTLPAAVAGARAGQRVKLIGGKREVTGTVTQAAAGRVLLVRGAKELAGQPVFVFGLEHADVRTVDYEALAMLNISATQELARQVAALQKQNAALKAEAAGSRAELQQFKAEASTQTAGLAQRLQALENMLGAKASVK